MGCHRVKYFFLGYFVAFQKRQSFLLSIPTEIYEYIYIFLYLNKENFAFLGSVRNELSRIAGSTIKMTYSKWNTREREMLITT